MTRLLSAVAILGALTAPAFDQDARLDTPPPTEPKTLTGRVIADDTGDPVRNARITVSGPTVGAPVVLTDGDGRFSLPAPGGGYRLVAGKSGYAPAEAAPALAGQPVEIRLRRGAVLSGRIVDDSGEPVIGARVSASIPTAARGNTRTQAAGDSDDRGEYRLAGLAAGTYTLQARTIGEPPLPGRAVDPGGATASVSGITYYPGVQWAADAEGIAIDYGEERFGLDFVVPSRRSGGQPFSVTRAIPMVRSRQGVSRLTTTPATSVVHGRVGGTDGAALGHAQVLLTFEADILEWRLTRADATGAFEFRDLPAGAVRIMASKPGYLPVLPARRDSGTRAPLEEGQTREGVEIRLTRWGTLDGRVLDEYGDPLQGASVQLLHIRYLAGRRRLVPAASAARPTDDLGRYRLYGLAPGQYVVSAAIGDVSSANVPGYLRSYFPGTPVAGQAQFVAVGEGQDVVGIDVAMSRTATARVSGKLIDAAGEPTMGGRVTLTPSQASSSVTSVPVGAALLRDGTFEFRNVPAGTYVIHAYRGRTNPWTEGEFGAMTIGVDNADVTDLILQTSRGSFITGRIGFDASGRARRPARSAIELSPVPADIDASPSDNHAAAEILGDWSFRLAGINGPRRLQLLRVPAGWTLKEILVNGVDVTDRPLPFGRANQSLSGVEVVLTDRISRVFGTILDEGARPAANARVIVFSTDRTRWYPASRFLRAIIAGSDGGFSLEGLPFDTYYAAAVAQLPAEGDEAWQDPGFLGSLIPRALTVTVREGEQRSIGLRVPALR